jgi:hypothetical protein
VVSPSTSSIFGTKSIKAGAPFNLTLNIRDQFRNPIASSSGAAVTVTVTNADATLIASDQEKFVYRISANIAGTYRANVQVNGVNVGVWDFSVVATDLDPSHITTTASCCSVAGSSSTVILNLFDRFNNTITIDPLTM